MSNSVRPIIETLFTSNGRYQPVDFDWRLITRHGRPFLLLPPGRTAARTGLNIYSAQRKRAKLWRQLLPMLFQTPLAGVFERVHVQADAASAFMQFLAQQSGVPAERIFPSAIKLSEVGSRSRLVLLLCDEGGRPTRVVKVGLNAAGREATDREADFLTQLPAEKIGGIRLTGRLATPELSAFATDYFPGTSPQDDAGLEHLFHDWLNPAETSALESLAVWDELASGAEKNLEVWQHLQSALAGKTVRATLYHGDFAPWNIRVVNSRNLQAFDWERGSRHGVPGWDWFHFTIQTAILAKRYSAERAAAEVEQLIHSARFKKYAAAAGISDIVQPLLLAYLLHQHWVIKPLEGSATTTELFDLLAAHWLAKPSPPPVVVSITAAEAPADGLWAAACSQLRGAGRQWCNLFWEPSLNSRMSTSWRKEFQAHWPVVLATGLLLAFIGAAQFHTTAHLMFLPFYVATCALLTWLAGRRWGALAAAVAAVIAPVVVAARDAGFRDSEVILWNTVMRFIILEMCVLFVDRIHKQRAVVHYRPAADSAPVELAENWAVLLACLGSLAVIAWLDYVTDPHLIFLPLYLFPCMVLTLASNLRWGLAAVLLTTGIATVIEVVTNKISDDLAEIFVWNFLMRLAVSLLVLVLLDRIRKENILFFNGRTNGH
jgi:hypothetical protein